MVAEVPQAVDATEATATEAVGVEDTGAVGGDVDDGGDDDSSSGMPGWLWIVIAIVVIAIIAGVIFMVVRNKEDQDFDAQQEDINMTNHNTGYEHDSHNRHH